MADFTQWLIRAYNFTRKRYGAFLGEWRRRGFYQFMRALSIGPKPFRYTSEAVRDAKAPQNRRGSSVILGCRIVIRPNETALVKWIFLLYTPDSSITSICKKVQPSCHPGRMESPSIRGILRKKLYRCKLQRYRIAHRLIHYQDGAITGPRIKNLSAPEQRLVRNDKFLRIIDPATWRRARNRE